MNGKYKAWLQLAAWYIFFGWARNIPIPFKGPNRSRFSQMLKTRAMRREMHARFLANIRGTLGSAPNSNASGVFGPSFLTVGDLTSNGNGATYRSTDHTAFNLATAALVAKGGGDLYVLPNTQIQPTKSLILNAPKVRYTFGSGSLIQLQAGVTFPTPIVSGGGATWTQIAVVGASSAISNVAIYGMTIDNSNHTNHAISGLVVGGNISGLDVFNLRTTNMERFGAWVIGYAEAPLGTAFDGSVSNVTFWAHTSNADGQTGGSPTDGGHLKVSNGSTSGSLIGVHSYDDYATALPVIGIDLPVANGANTAGTRDYLISGAHLEGTGANVQTGIFLESQDSAGAQNSAQDFRIEYCWVSGFANGYSVDATNENVEITDCTAISCTTTGLAMSATLNASRTSIANQGWTVSNFVSRKCAAHITLSSSGLIAGHGMVFGPVVIQGGAAFDDGAAVLNTGIQITTTAAKPLKDVLVERVNLANLNGGGTALSTAGATGGLNVYCRSNPGASVFAIAVTSAYLGEVLAATVAKSETQAADANVLTYTPDLTAGVYGIDFAVDVSSATSGVIGLQVTYKDTNTNVPASPNPSGFQLNTAAPAKTFTVSAAGNFWWQEVISVDNSGTAIVVKWPGGGTSAAKVSASIRRLG